MIEKLKNKIDKAATPVMKQFWSVKAQYPDALLLFRMGDFYETFDKDAEISSNVLGIALTKRANGAASSVPLAGFPYHSLDQHIHKLLNAGYKVAICEQVENPKESKGIVRREVVEVLSPGAALSDKFLAHNENNYLCSLYESQKTIGYSILDYSTGDFFTGIISSSKINHILIKFNIKEIIVNEEQQLYFDSLISGNVLISNYNSWIANKEVCYDKLLDHFQTKSLKGYGIEDDDLSIISSGAAIYYVENNFFGRIKHITSISKLSDNDYMQLDSFTIQNLEIFNSFSNNQSGTLIKSIDYTITSMGSRLLKSNLIKPLKNIKEINKRLSYVDEIINHPQSIGLIEEHFQKTYDIQRIMSKISASKANPIDLVNLSASLKVLPNLCKDIKEMKLCSSLLRRAKNTQLITSVIDNEIFEQPSINISKGGFIKDGISKELDDLREISTNANKWLLAYQAKERERLSISSLKISYNKVFGYYIDITKTHLNKVPENYIRKQTLTNSERYFTQELKDYEVKILSSNDRIKEIELEIFNKIIMKILSKISNIQYNANIIAQMDVFLSHAKLAKMNNYCKPNLSKKRNEINLVNARHPVIERLLPPGEKFISNSLNINSDKNQIAIITGPNMGGKSTFLRQIGIISILAQIGSYVPADKADLCIIDQLFTRVGANDNLSGGESTFLVEMNEAANILNNATKHSLIILDELGRGTSTFDGLSLAWAITEYIHNNSTIKAKTLFATHYHELINLAEDLPNAFNLNVDVKEKNGEIFFIRKIKKGGASKSYGINVAKMAGIPLHVINRANELLSNFFKNKKNHNLIADKNIVNSKQEELFNSQNEAIKIVNELDLNTLSPIEALNKLAEIKKYLDE